MSEQKNNKGLLIVLLIALIASIGGNFIQMKSNQDTVEEKDYEIDSLVTIGAELKAEIIDFERQVEKYVSENDGLSDELASKKEELEKRKATIDQLLKEGKLNKSVIAQLRREKKAFEKEKEDLLEQIDKYITENKTLKKENEVLYSTVSELETVREELAKQVNVASLVKAEYLTFSALKQRGDKFKVTSLARRASKFEACMSLLENKVTGTGTKTVYLTIFAPNGQAIGDTGKGSGTFINPTTNEEVLYSSKQEIEYNGETMENICISYDEGNKRFEAGDYLAKIYVDGVLSNTTMITLK